MRLREALQRVLEDLEAGAVEVTLDRPREAGHGDLATNVALKLAKPLKRAPRQLAEEIVERLDVPPEVVSRVEVAGPGFINFWLSGEAVTDVLPRILSHGQAFGRSTHGAGQRVNVEFVSANPTGPLHVGHGRGAAMGDAIASLLEATGYDVTREFYLNDAGVQIDKVAQSVWARVQQCVGRDAEIPDGGYHGEYLVELAQRILEDEGREFADLPESEALERCRTIAVQAQREEQDRDLAEFGVVFDVYSRESAAYESGALDKTLTALHERGVTYEQDDALWLRTTEFGDSKDRVLRKRDGTYTYVMPDIAYHRDKAARGFDFVINVLGADHHGYIDRMRAALLALGQPREFFEVVLVQIVRVMKHGKEVKFSKRSGDSVTLRYLFEQTGVDAARYFFLMRKGDSQFVFDIDLATKQTDENPVYYVQYAHTRMCGIFRTAEIDATGVSADELDLSVLTEPDEMALMLRLAEYPALVARAAEAREPHRVIGYLEDLARLVNGWYHRHRVVGAPEAIMQARLALTRAAQIVLANGLQLLGINAPERM